MPMKNSYRILVGYVIWKLCFFGVFRFLGLFLEFSRFLALRRLNCAVAACFVKLMIGH